MAKLNIILETRYKSKSGKYPVKISIGTAKDTAYIPTDITLPAEAWIGNGNQRPVKSSYAGAKIYNDRIEKFYLVIRARLMELEAEGRAGRMTALQIRNYVSSDKPTKSRLLKFFEFAAEYMKRIRRDNTRQAYSYMIAKLLNFTDEDITFEAMNVAFIRKFNDAMSDAGLGVNSRSIVMRNIRTLFNAAINDELIDANVYPFRKFEIKSATKNKESLTPAEIKTLYLYPFQTQALCMARDFFMLSFFLCGINPVDLFKLKRGDGDYITYCRSKTDHENFDYIRLLLQDEAKEIVNRYKSDENSEYLLYFAEKYVDFDTFYHFVSKKIREIRDICGFTGMTLYWARYSWATIADGLDVVEKTISKGLGHKDRSIAGRNYITYDWGKVDAANRLVIDACLM
jgi:integrase